MRRKLYLAAFITLALLAGCGGGSSASSDPPAATASAATVQQAASLPACAPGTTSAPLNCTCPANHLQGDGSCVVDAAGSTSAGPPPAPGAVVGAWMGDVSTSGKWTYSGGVCLAVAAPNGAPFICADLLDYSAMVTGQYQSLSASGAWTSPSGSVRGPVWKWPIDANGNLIGTRLTVAQYPVDPGIEQPSINLTYPETWALAFGYTGTPFFDTPPVSMNGFTPQVSLAGVWAGAYCQRVACALSVGSDGTLNAQDANGCVYTGVLTGSLTSVAQATVVDCNGVTYSGLAVVAPHAAGPSFTDWSAPWIVILGSAGTTGQLVISNEYAPRVPT